MPSRTPKVGDKVMHHGHLHEIMEMRDRAVMEDGTPTVVHMVVFENEGYRVLGFLNELRWLEKDQAWYLMGRVLARDERTLYEAAFGVWPAAEIHLTARAALDAIDFADVDRSRLLGVIRRRRLARETDEKPDEYAARVEAYANAAIEHCKELRTLRQEA